MPKLFKVFLTPLFLVLLTALSMPSQSLAKSGDWQSAEHARARLVSTVDSVGPVQSFEAAIEIRLSDGWHTYWKNAGDAGLPPRFDWTKSVNVKDVDILWPVPERKEESGFFVFGYDGTITLPLRVNLDDGFKKTDINLNLGLMICEEICIPQNFDLSLSLEPGGGKPTSHARMLEFVKKSVPAESSETLSIDTIIAGPDAVVVTARSESGFSRADIFAYSDEIPFSAPAEIKVDDKDETRAMFTLKKPDGIDNLKAELMGQRLYVTLVTRRDAVETSLQF